MCEIRRKLFDHQSQLIQNNIQHTLQIIREVLHVHEKSPFMSMRRHLFCPRKVTFYVHEKSVTPQGQPGSRRDIIPRTAVESPLVKNPASCASRYKIDLDLGNLKRIQSNLVIRNVLIRNILVLRNHFQLQIVNLLHEDKEHLALRNNFRVTKKFIT